MIITKKALSRRTFLRGAGTVLALPALESMVPALRMLKILLNQLSVCLLGMFLTELLWISGLRKLRV